MYLYDERVEGLIDQGIKKFGDEMAAIERSDLVPEHTVFTLTTDDESKLLFKATCSHTVATVLRANGALRELVKRFDGLQVPARHVAFLVTEWKLDLKHEFHLVFVPRSRIAHQCS